MRKKERTQVSTGPYRYSRDPSWLLDSETILQRQLHRKRTRDPCNPTDRIRIIRLLEREDPRTYGVKTAQLVCFLPGQHAVVSFLILGWWELVFGDLGGVGVVWTHAGGACVGYLFGMLDLCQFRRLVCGLVMDEEMCVEYPCGYLGRSS